MTSRERVQQSLNHRQPDRVPVEFGATPTTGMHVTVVEALRRHYGLEPRPVKVNEPYQMLGLVEEDLAQALGLDVDGFGARTTIFGFPNEGWREYRLPWGQAVLVSAHFQTTPAPGGDLLIYPQGDRSAPPSGRMPVGGFFFDSIVRQPPLEEARLDPEDNLEEFGPVSQVDLKHFR
ncbi:MAG: methyltransferase, partial [Gemmatimonadota bacterium]